MTFWLQLAFDAVILTVLLLRQGPPGPPGVMGPPGPAGMTGRCTCPQVQQ